MSNRAQSASAAYRCPVSGCKKRDIRRFTALGLTQHILSCHGIAEFEKRMKVKVISR